MEHRDSHPSREELLRAADGELSPRLAERLQRHLSACWECRSQMQELEEAIGDYIRLHRRNLDPLLPPVVGPRSLLKARLDQLASSAQSYSWHWFEPVSWRIGLVAALAICIVASIGFLVRHDWGSRSQSSRYAGAEPAAIPDASLTPGLAVAASREELCRERPPKNRMIPASLRRRVFETYGISRADPRAYEVDYLITPALGGADDIRNLWPQSYSATTWNARVKDTLEDRLQELVCGGELDLATAQRDISRNWIAAYKKYLRTDRPIGLLPH